jgi:hypothetical protein
MNECQVLGLQHFELSRMLLAAYDPNLQRIGLGTSGSMNILESSLRRSTIRLCGLALSDSSQAAMVTAAVGISMCGEYILNPGEQKAIEDFLDVLEREHAWANTKHYSRFEGVLAVMPHKNFVKTSTTLASGSSILILSQEMDSTYSIHFVGSFIISSELQFHLRVAL